MLTAAEGQLDFHSLPDADASWRRGISRYEAFFGRKPDASTWIAAPGQAVYSRIDDARLSSGDDMSEAGYFIRPSAESKGFMVRTILRRVIRITRNVLVVRNPTARLAQLALSDDLARTYGSPHRAEAYHDAVRSLFDQYPDETLIRPLILEDPLSGMPRALVPAVDEYGDFVMTHPAAWPQDKPSPSPSPLARVLPCKLLPHGVLGDAVTSMGATMRCAGPRPDGLCCVVDPLRPESLRDGTGGDGGATRAIRGWLGRGHCAWTDDDISRLREPGDALLRAHARDGGTAPVIHVLCPLLDSLQPAPALRALVRSYRNVLCAFANSEYLTLRLLPICGGGLAGKHRSQLAAMTAQALALAFESLDARAQSRLRTCSVSMCIFRLAELRDFAAAGFSSGSTDGARPTPTPGAAAEEQPLPPAPSEATSVPRTGLSHARAYVQSLDMNTKVTFITNPKRGESGRRYAIYQAATTKQKFLELHDIATRAQEKARTRRPTRDKRKVRPYDDLAWDYLHGFATFDDPVGKVDAVLAAARAHTGRPIDAHPGDVSVAVRDEGATLGHFAHLERLEGSLDLAPLVGDMEQLAALAGEGGIGDGLSSFDDVYAPVSMCPAGDFWRAAMADELRDDRALPWRLVDPQLTQLVYDNGDMPNFGVGDCGTILAQPWVGRDDLGRPADSGAGVAPAKPGNMPAGIVAPLRSIAAARRTAEWGIPGGWREAAQAEIHRVFDHFKCIVYVPLTDRAEKIRKYGKTKVHTLHLVVPCKEKRDSDGGFTRRKIRITTADLVSLRKIPNTFAANISADSGRYMAQLELELRAARSEHWDVGGAYFHGTPDPPESPGGRVIYAPVPPAWDEFGYPAVSPAGVPMVFRIDGNLPGRQEAGAIFSRRYTEFLLEFGFTQSVVDRRVFFLFDPERLLLCVGVFVDDNKVLIESEVMAAAFRARWALEFDEAPDMEATSRDFLGVAYRRVGSHEMELSCGKALRDLADKLTDLPKPRGTTCATPLPENGLRQLQEGPSDGNPLMPTDLLPRARSIVGLGGWIVCHVRPDAFLAFVAVSQNLASNFTRHAWERILQWAHYLVDTRDLKLILRRTGCAPVQYVDSSALNGPRGGSFGGHVTQFVEGDPAAPDAKVSGAISWRCVVPRVLGDSSAAAELIMCSIALKQTLGERMLARELGQTPPGPTSVYMDASAVLHGAEAERVSRETRYLAARYEMLRSAVHDLHVALKKVATDFNTGDVLTKALVGRAFRLHRSRILGHPPEATTDAA